jgi:Nif-specific regulatory protein
VAEIPFESQSKLLQLLQSRHYYPLGATEPVEADIRLIAATNMNLDDAVRDRRLREDLRFRLEVLPVRMPSLSERKSDLPPLAEALLERVCSRNRLPRLDLSPGAVRAIAEADWPGNVRQLENALEAAAIRAAGLRGTRVEAGHVFRERATQDDDRPELLSFQDQTRRFQRDLLRRTLDETDWNVTETAHRLDLARSHVYNLIRAFDLIRRPNSPTQQKGT